MRGDLGSAAADEETESASAADGPGRALDERRERASRRDRLSGPLPGPAGQPRPDAGIGLGRLQADRFRFQRQRRGASRIRAIATLLRGIEADRIGPSGGGADIGPSVQAGKVPAMSLEVDGNYFLLHHTPADTVDKIDPMDMARASGAIAVMAYVIADMQERLR